MSIWKVIFGKDENNDRKYGNNFDESKRYYEAHYTFNVYKSADELFKELIELILQPIDNKNIVGELVKGKVLIDKNNGRTQKYIITEFIKDKLIETNTIIGEDQYWNHYELSEHKNKTRFTFTQKIKYHKTIAGAPGQMAARKFRKDVILRGTLIQNYLTNK